MEVNSILYIAASQKIPFAWESNPYFLYFYGSLFFERKFPCDPSDFVHFRRRIGETEVEKIFAYSVKLHGEAAPVQTKFALSDTTVQGLDSLSGQVLLRTDYLLTYP
jgi:IS5 family transposase